MSDTKTLERITAKNTSSDGKKKSDVFTGIVASALGGITAGTMVLMLLAFVLGKLSEPEKFYTICALAISIAAGLVAGRLAAVRAMQASKLVRALGVVLLMSIVIWIASAVIVSGEAGGQLERELQSSGIVSFVAMLVSAFISTGTGVKKRKTVKRR